LVKFLFQYFPFFQRANKRWFFIKTSVNEIHPVKVIHEGRSLARTSSSNPNPGNKILNFKETDGFL